MLSGNVENKKQFMSLLLKGNAFDKLLLRSAVLKTSVLYEIDCTLIKSYFDSDMQDGLEKYASWADMKPILFSLIKGNRLPGYMKLILSPNSEATEKIHKNAAALFINIVFENNTLTVTTGCSQKQFTLDKAVEITWDEYAVRFFKHNGIILE